MGYRAALLIGIVLSGAKAFADGPLSESQSAQSLLSEVRTLRNDLRMAIITAQRMQVVLYRLQTQEAAVTRATQKLEEIRSQLVGAEESKKSITASLQQMEEQMNGTQDVNARKLMEAQISRFKSMLDRWGGEFPKLQAKKSEALSQLQNEQQSRANSKTRWTDLTKRWLRCRSLNSGWRGQSSCGFTTCSAGPAARHRLRMTCVNC